MMKLIIIALLLWLMPAGGRAVVCDDADRARIDTLLHRAKTMPRATCWELFFARAFIGTPYVAHTLEVTDSEELVVNTAGLDCTTLVETVAALTMCAVQEVYTFKNYLCNLGLLRYRGGNMTDYTSRLHYFTDWIIDNTGMGLVEEIQQPSEVFSAVQTINVGFMSEHPSLYRHLKANPSYVSVIRQTEEALCGLTFRYIPKSGVVNDAMMREAVHDGDIIAITCNKPGLDIAHLGFAVWHADGLHLLNASMIHKKVVEEPMTLYRYLGKHPSHTGIRIVRITR